MDYLSSPFVVMPPSREREKDLPLPLRLPF